MSADKERDEAITYLYGIATKVSFRYRQYSSPEDIHWYAAIVAIDAVDKTPEIVLMPPADLRPIISCRMRMRAVDGIRSKFGRNGVSDSYYATRKSIQDAQPLYFDDGKPIEVAEDSDLLGSLIEASRLQLFRQSVESLSDRPRFIMEQSLNGVYMRDIGASLGVTESRVCQIQRATIKMLKSRLRRA